MWRWSRVLLRPEILCEISLFPSIFLGDSPIHLQDHTDFTGNLGGHLSAVVSATVINCDSVTGGTCGVQTACCSNNNVVSLHCVSLHSPLRTDGIALFFFLFHAERCCLRPRCCQRVKLTSKLDSPSVFFALIFFLLMLLPLPLERMSQ